MKTAKIKKKYYKDLSFMYHDLGLIENNSCNPSNVLCSKEDYELIKKTIRAEFKKQNPYASKKSLDFSVGMHLLNLGPNEVANQAIRPGYLLILEDSNKEEAAE